MPPTNNHSMRCPRRDRYLAEPLLTCGYGQKLGHNVSLSGEALLRRGQDGMFLAA
ncbi:MAG: hypothetical protein R2682_07970 [Pyrinomonadaceae bacterium]